MKNCKCGISEVMCDYHRPEQIMHSPDPCDEIYTDANGKRWYRPVRVGPGHYSVTYEWTDGEGNVHTGTNETLDIEP